MLLFLLFIGIPIIEITLFIAMGALIGFWASISIVLISAIMGMFILRSQGVKSMETLRENLEHGHNPTLQIAHSALILFAGALLFLPGYFTDTIGLLLLIPPVRSLAIHRGAARLAARTVQFNMRGQKKHSPAEDRTIDDVDYSVVDEKNPKKSGWTKRD